MNLSKTFQFGKIDYYGNNQKSCSVEIKASLKDGVFSAYASIWNPKHTDIVMGGQCFDDIARTPVGSNPTFRKLYRLWKLYHLNDTCVGTPVQEDVLQEAGLRKADDYDKACAYLKELHLYELPAHEADPYRKPNSPHLGQPFKYGHEWLFRPIPQTDLNEIIELLGGQVPEDPVHTLILGLDGGIIEGGSCDIPLNVIVCDYNYDGADDSEIKTNGWGNDCIAYDVALKLETPDRMAELTKFFYA